MIAVHNASMPPNCEPMPKMNIIKKNETAHKCGNGIISTASGYAINAKPGPDCTTSATSTSKFCAMKPIIENTAKPANIAVNALVSDTITVSKWQLFLNWGGRGCVRCARVSERWGRKTDEKVKLISHFLLFMIMMDAVMFNAMKNGRILTWQYEAKLTSELLAKPYE